MTQPVSMIFPDQFRLTGRTALITGSARGLGWEMAKGLAEAGARILLHGRSLERVTDRVAELRALGGRLAGEFFAVGLELEDVFRVANLLGFEFRDPLSAEVGGARFAEQRERQRNEERKGVGGFHGMFWDRVGGFGGNFHDFFCAGGRRVEPSLRSGSNARDAGAAFGVSLATVKSFFACSGVSFAVGENFSLAA